MCSVLLFSSPDPLSPVIYALKYKLDYLLTHISAYGGFYALLKLLFCSFQSICESVREREREEKREGEREERERERAREVERERRGGEERERERGEEGGRDRVKESMCVCIHKCVNPCEQD